MDQQPEKRLRPLRLAARDDLVEVVGYGCEIRPALAHVGPRPASRGELGLLGAEVFETRLKPRQPLVEALGGELALFEGLGQARVHDAPW